MKKNLFYYLFAVICTIGLFTSCSDDDEKVLCPIGETTFTDSKGLQLTYSGEMMLGKSVIFTPNSSDATKATLTLTGNRELAMIDTRETHVPPISGVIPGQSTTTLNIENMVIDGNKVIFEGVEESNGCIIKYKGDAISGEMNLALEVTMPSNPLANTSWNMAPTGSMWEGDPMAPIHVKWDADEFPFEEYDYVVDAVDTVTAKIALVMKCKELDIPIISSMGAGNKLDASAFRVTDIYKTKVCPLAKVMRRELKKRGVKKLKVVYSEEEPIRPLEDTSDNCNVEETCQENLEYKAAKRRSTPGSVAFVPSVAGLIIAGEVIKDLAKCE